jgi:regulator of replication initiation timing
MNKTEIAESLRKEVGELEITIKKVQARCDRLKRFVIDLEDEIAGPQAQTFENSKLRKVIDRVFGEKPKRSKR